MLKITWPIIYCSHSVLQCCYPGDRKCIGPAKSWLPSPKCICWVTVSPELQRLQNANKLDHETVSSGWIWKNGIQEQREIIKNLWRKILNKLKAILLSYSDTVCSWRSSYCSLKFATANKNKHHAILCVAATEAEGRWTVSRTGRQTPKEQLHAQVGRALVCSRQPVQRWRDVAGRTPGHPRSDDLGSARQNAAAATDLTIQCDNENCLWAGKLTNHHRNCWNSIIITSATTTASLSDLRLNCYIFNADNLSPYCMLFTPTNSCNVLVSRN